MKLYCVALSAVRRPKEPSPNAGQLEHGLAALGVAYSEADAPFMEGGARNVCLDRFPPDQGWYGHNEVVVRVPDEELAKLGVR